MGDDFFDHARNDLFPKVKGSAMSVLIAGNPDPKLCMELGAAILFDKPIICLVTAGRAVPANLRRVANVIVEGDLNDDVVKQRLQDAIDNVLKNNARVKVQ